MQMIFIIITSNVTIHISNTIDIQLINVYTLTCFVITSISGKISMSRIVKVISRNIELSSLYFEKLVWNREFIVVYNQFRNEN